MCEIIILSLGASITLMDLLNFDNDCCFSLIGAIIIMHSFAGAVSIGFCVVVKIPKVESCT